MNEKPVAIVLGGIVPHKNLLEKLKKRGYYTILIDYFENPPAAAAADLHLRESAMDKEAVLRAAKKYHAAWYCVPVWTSRSRSPVKWQKELNHAASLQFKESNRSDKQRKNETDHVEKRDSDLALFFRT